MIKLNEREYIADNGCYIVCKANKLKYKKIKLSLNDCIENYEEVGVAKNATTKNATENVSITEETPIKVAKKWGKQVD